MAIFSSKNEQVQQHSWTDTGGSASLAVRKSGHIYELSAFAHRHPGGRKVLQCHAGKEVADVMRGKSHRHSEAAMYLMESYKLDDNHQKNAIQDLENLVDWSKPMFWQVGQLGKQYKTWVHLPVDRPLRLFRYDFIEFFSKTPWFVVPIVWLPLAIYLLYRGVLMSTVLHDSAGPAWYSALLRYTFLASCVGVSVLGCISWSLIEYCLHRFVFHAEPPSESPFWISMHFVLHGQHHKVPFDPGRLVFPPVAASLFVIVLYFSLCSLLPDAVASCYTSGTLFGYVCYDLTHYYLHHGVPSNGSYFDRLKKHHVQHHFAQQNRGFGISTKLWDQPFNTMIKWNCPAEEEDDEKEGHKSQ